LKILGSAYGAAAAWRRRWYARDPSRRRPLQRPVVSVGNLAVGGKGKTPIVAHIARLLTAQGERPAILSRGYGRSRIADGATVVSDGSSIAVGADLAGDEPLMLARALPAVAVLVGANRYVSGRLAEERLGATVNLLDDGFQHLGLARDVDLIVTDADDLTDAPMPAGRLRERLHAATQADAALVHAPDEEAAGRVARALGLPTFFRVVRQLGVPRMIASDAVTAIPPRAKVVALAGIARPERFFRDLQSAGWNVVEHMTFHDHHRFTPSDIDRVAAAARAAGAVVLTTEKDAMRLEGMRLGGLAVAAVPLSVAIEPADEFSGWLRDRLAKARGSHDRARRAESRART
jgi:tetraacyldisaccharide 4'-kinase